MSSHPTENRGARGHAAVLLDHLADLRRCFLGHRHLVGREGPLPGVLATEGREGVRGQQ